MKFKGEKWRPEAVWVLKKRTRMDKIKDWIIDQMLYSDQSWSVNYLDEPSLLARISLWSRRQIALIVACLILVLLGFILTI